MLGPVKGRKKEPPKSLSNNLFDGEPAAGASCDPQKMKVGKGPRSKAKVYPPPDTHTPQFGGSSQLVLHYNNC